MMTHSAPSDRLLRGEHVRLTAFEPDDVKTLAAWYEHTEFMRRWDAEPANPRTEQEVRDYVDKIQKAPNGFVFALRLLDRPELIGYLELDGIIWSQGSGWVSIGIGDPAQRGQGYGSEGLALLLDFAFGELNLRRVQLTVFSYNPRAIGVYERLGFQREGVFREFLQRDGELYDMLLYGLLRREWETRGPRKPRQV